MEHQKWLTVTEPMVEQMQEQYKHAQWNLQNIDQMTTMNIDTLKASTL
jgi:hypothetical protein